MDMSARPPSPRGVAHAVQKFFMNVRVDLDQQDEETGGPLFSELTSLLWMSTPDNATVCAV